MPNTISLHVYLALFKIRQLHCSWRIHHWFKKSCLVVIVIELHFVVNAIEVHQKCFGVLCAPSSLVLSFTIVHSHILIENHFALCVSRIIDKSVTSYEPFEIALIVDVTDHKEGSPRYQCFNFK